MPESTPDSTKHAPCQYSTAGPGKTTPAPGWWPGFYAILPKRGLVLSILTILGTGPHCLLINRGSQNPGTMVIAIVGFFMLYMGLRFLFGRIEQGYEIPSVFRFLGGILAGLVIFLA